MAWKNSVSIGLSSGGFGGEERRELHRGVTNDPLQSREELLRIGVGKESDVYVSGRFGRDDIGFVGSVQPREADGVSENRVPVQVVENPLASRGVGSRDLHVREPLLLLPGVAA